MKSNNLKHLVDEIFNMAKLDANEFPLKEEELDFSEVTREVLIEFLPELSKHNIELQIRIRVYLSYHRRSSKHYADYR